MQLRVLGARDAVRALDRLAAKTRKAMARKAMTAATKPLLKSLRRVVPSRSGFLRRSLASKVRSYPMAIVGLVGQDKRKRFGDTKATGRKALRQRLKFERQRRRSGGISRRGDVVPIHLIENPVRAHVIPGPLTIRLPGGRFARVNQIRHPGHSGKRVIERTENSSGAEAVRQFEQTFGEEMDAST